LSVAIWIRGVAYPARNDAKCRDLEEQWDRIETPKEHAVETPQSVNDTALEATGTAGRLFGGHGVWSGNAGLDHPGPKIGGC
jgi:hypothetical protein